MEHPPTPPVDAADQARHLTLLRELLAQDYLQSTHWAGALRDLAARVARCVEARLALVALLGEDRRWSAVTSTGQRLGEDQISSAASLTALERVRASGEPLIAMEEEGLDLDSESVRRAEAASMLVVPLFFQDVTAPDLPPTLGGCIYAHRTLAQPPFRAWHAEVVTDVARLTQPRLNLLKHLGRVEEELERSRGALEVLASRAGAPVSLGAFHTLDPHFGREVLEPLKRVAAADRVNVLLLGPTGAGKTHLAQAWHLESARKKGPFVLMDCAQVTSAETLGAELFGYAPDSGYANAPRAGRPGKAQLAHKGTLFIDEIATLPPELQQKLLRLVERGEFTPLGGSEVKKVDLQVVSATLEDLPTRVAERSFREDLFWRLSDLVVRLPALSQRRADIPSLAQDFLDLARQRTGRREVLSLRDDALRRLVEYPWERAGNLRGLERSIFRSVLMAPQGTRRLGAPHLHLQELSPPQGAPAPASAPPPPAQAAGPARLSPAEQQQLDVIVQAIREHKRATDAAQALGMTYRELTWRLHKVGLSVKEVLSGR